MRAAYKIQTEDWNSGEEYMRAVFSAARAGLCLLDAEGAVLAVNEMGKTLMQVDGRSVIGRQFGLVVNLVMLFVVKTVWRKAVVMEKIVGIVRCGAM